MNWSGSDVGAGIASYDIYVSTNTGPWTIWLSGATATQASFQGKFGDRYRFYSFARDQAGNLEAPPAAPDAEVTLVEPDVEFHYQGRVVVDRLPFSGTGQFKFALINADRQPDLLAERAGHHASGQRTRFGGGRFR